LGGSLRTKNSKTAVFEFFVRKLPPNRGFLLAAGLEHALDFLEAVHFSNDEIDSLARTGRFEKQLLDYLAAFRFTGDVHAMPEGTIFFANEPILRVTAPLPEAQFVETRLINLLHFQSLIASKASRFVLAAPDPRLVEMVRTKLPLDHPAINEAAYCLFRLLDSDNPALPGLREKIMQRRARQQRRRNDLFGGGGPTSRAKTPPAKAKAAARFGPLSESEYDASAIEVLEGLEPVRRRPGMYIGGTDANAMHHLFAEVLDNAMDEAVAQFATHIEVSFEEGGWISVTDNGRGFPIGHPAGRVGRCCAGARHHRAGVRPPLRPRSEGHPSRRGSRVPVSCLCLSARRVGHSTNAARSRRDTALPEAL